MECPISEEGLIGSPVYRKTQSKYSSRACLQYACVRFQDRSKELIPKPQVGNTSDVLSDGALRIRSSQRITVREAYSETAWPEEGLRV
jgi:hypothetical protein